MSAAPKVVRRACLHENPADGWAYFDFYREHWPIRICMDCRTILEGRDRHPDRRVGPIWKVGPDDVIAGKWASQWPKYGRPRRKRPPASTEWPKLNRGSRAA
jgi:hypothetical protein